MNVSKALINERFLNYIKTKTLQLYLKRSGNYDIGRPHTIRNINWMGEKENLFYEIVDDGNEGNYRHSKTQTERESSCSVKYN